MQTSRKSLIWTIAIVLLGVVIVSAVLFSESGVPASKKVAVEDADAMVEIKLLKSNGELVERKGVLNSNSKSQAEAGEFFAYEAKVLKVLSGEMLSIGTIRVLVAADNDVLLTDAPLVIPTMGAAYKVYLKYMPAYDGVTFEIIGGVQGMQRIDTSKRQSDGSSEAKVLVASHTGTVVWIEPRQPKVYVADRMTTEDALDASSLSEVLSKTRAEDMDIAQYSINEPVRQLLRVGQRVRIDSSCTEQLEQNPPIRCADQVTLLGGSGLSAEIESWHKRGESIFGRYERKLKELNGQLPTRARRITEAEVRDIVTFLPMKGMDEATSIVALDYFVNQFNTIHGAPDFVGGSGIIRYEYWFDESGSARVVVFESLNQVALFKGEQSEIVFNVAE